MKTKFILLLFVIALCISRPNKTIAQVNVQDSLALVDLYNSTDGPHWTSNTNWLTTAPISKWYGITINKNRVIKISLYANNLQGNIPSSLGNLTHLQDLELQDNQLNGSIPPELGNLIQLRSLALFSNELSSSIPSSLSNLTNVTYFDLSNNKLSGNIPSSFGNLTNLQSLSLSNNHLSGSIPSSLGNLPHLQDLELINNHLSGGIPSSLGNTKLSGLYLNYNQLSGSIPSSLGNLTHLENLQLDHNQLSVSIPSSFGNLTYLQGLFLDHNQLSGSIPSSLGNIPDLEDLILDHNQLSGVVPASLTNLNSFIALSLQNNWFTFDGMEAIARHFYSPLYRKQKNITIHQNNNILSVYAGGTLSNNTYKWYNGANLVATIKGDSTYRPTSSGNYYVTVRNSIAKQLTLYSDTVNYSEGENLIAGRNNNVMNENFSSTASAYPNPAKTNATVLFKAAGKYVIEITDMNGKILQTKTGTSIDKKQNTVQLNVSSYASGMYLITIVDEKNKKQTLKLNKQ